ncbi:hypothetical protein FQA39_LY05785 [Lamprigera yunnana]|nr:hypothetical protein FQA39_LY05785 [Lamprigera yunnana]
MSPSNVQHEVDIDIIPPDADPQIDEEDFDKQSLDGEENIFPTDVAGEIELQHINSNDEGGSYDEDNLPLSVRIQNVLKSKQAKKEKLNCDDVDNNKILPLVAGSVKYFLKCFTTSRFDTIPPFSMKYSKIISTDSSLAAMTVFKTRTSESSSSLPDLTSNFVLRYDTRGIQKYAVSIRRRPKC